MKSLFTTCFLFLAALVVGQAQNLPVDNNTMKITYIRVVEATGLSAGDLFKYAKEWGTKKGFKIKSEDASKNEIVFEGTHKVDYQGKVKPESGNVNFTFSLFLKEGKYRYIATDFVHVGANKAPSGGKLENVNPECGTSGMTSATWQLIKKKTQTNMEALVGDLEKTIKEIQNDPAKKSDW